ARGPGGHGAAVPPVRAGGRRVRARGLADRGARAAAGGEPPCLPVGHARPVRPVTIRALYADLDGTLLGPGGSLYATPSGLSDRGASALATLHGAGVDLVLVSGRTRDQMREAGRILFARAAIAELGALIVERDEAFTETIVTNYGA